MVILPFVTIYFYTMQIIPLSEGSFTVDASKKFVPFVFSEDELSGRGRGSLLVEIIPFLVITKHDLLLFDTGLGFKTESGQLQIFKTLAAHGINPGDITKVLMSHLHKDHIGGMINPYTNAPAFENAIYYIQKRELDYALEKGAPSYNTDSLDLISPDQMVLLHEDEGTIDGYISYKLTQAHAKYHQVFWVKEDNETVFFGGDDAPQLHQMKHKFAAKYDFDGVKARDLREEWWQQGLNEGWTFLFYHDRKHPVYHKHKV